MASQEVGRLNVVVGLDGTGFQQGVSNLNRQLKVVQSEFQAASARLGDFGKNTEGLKLKADSLNKQIELQKQKIEALKGAYDKSVTSKGADAKATQDLEIKLNKARAALGTMESDLKKTTAELEKQSSVWTKLSTKLDQVGNKMRDIGKTLSTSVTLPIVGLGTAIAITGAKFDESMSKVQAVSGATADEMEKLRQQAKDLGASTKFSASQAADAMSFLGMAGFNTSQIMSSMPGLLDLAAAGALDLGRAADIASNIMSGFNMGASEMGRISDVLAKTAASANTSVEQMGFAMSYVAPVASSAGLSIEETAAAIGTLSNAGIQGERAGTALRGIIASLLSPTGQTTDALKKLGLSASDVNPAMNSISDILKKLAGSGIDTATAMQLVGVEAGPGLLALLTQGEEGIKNFTAELQNASGAANQMAKTMSDNLKGNFDELKSSVEGLSLSFYEEMRPALIEITKKVTEMTRWFNELEPGTKRFIVAIAALAAAVGPLLTVLGMLSIALNSLITMIGVKAALATGGLTVLLGALAAAGIYLATNWEKVSARMTVIFKNIELAGKSAFTLLYEGVTNIMARMASYVLTKVNEMLTAIAPLTKIMPESIASGFESMQASVRRNMESAASAADASARKMTTASQIFNRSLKSMTGTGNTKSDVRELHEEMAELKFQTGGVVTSLDSATSSIQKYNPALEAAGEKAKKAGEKKAKAAKDTREEWKKTADDMKASLDVIRAQFELAMISLGQNAEESRKLQTELDFLNQQYIEQQKIVNNARSGYETMLKTKGKAAKETADAAKSYASEAKTLNELSSRITDVQLLLSRQPEVTAEAREALEILRAEHEKGTAALDLNATKVDELQLKQTQLSQTLEAQRVLISDLTREYEASKEAKGADSVETRKAYMELIRAQTEEAKLQKEIRSTNKAIKDQANELKDLSSKLTDLSKKMDEVIAKEKDQLAKAHEEYQRKVAEINQRLVDDERRVTDQYQKALDERAKSLANFIGLFDEVKTKDVSGDQLLENLRGQVDAFEDWQDNIKSLAARGIDQGLLAELREMGPKAGAEIAALNSLSDDQLQQYVTLWRQKSEAARREAASQLESQRIETQQKIAELRQQAAEQLEQYRQDWEKKNAEIRANTQKEIDTINKAYQDIVTKSKDYGVNMMSSFIDGARSKFADLHKMLEDMARTIDDYMPHSPAKVGPLRRLGEWGPGMIDTFVAGIEANMPKLESAIHGMAALAPNALAPSLSGVGNRSSSVVNNSGGNVINLYVQQGWDQIERELLKRGIKID